MSAIRAVAIRQKCAPRHASTEEVTKSNIDICRDSAIFTDGIDFICNSLKYS